MTNRFILFLLLCAPVSTYANYFDDNYIFGGSFVGQSTDIVSSNNTSSSKSGDGIEIFMDRYYHLTYRLKTTLSYVTYDEFDVLGLMESADYFIPVATDFSLFVGATAGGALQKFHDGSVGDASAGFLYGVQLGGMHYISESYLVEYGFRLKATDLVTRTNAVTTSTISELNELYVSILFMF